MPRFENKVKQSGDTFYICAYHVPTYLNKYIFTNANRFRHEYKNIIRDVKLTTICFSVKLR